MRLPNFFIIGAPKCGTTSLASWLSEHPKLYMSPVKEPHYFNTDDNVPGRFSDVEYLSLFRQATDDHIAIGESSVWYLWSKHAVPNIMEFNSEAKFIVCLRNPIQMAYALHHQQLYAGNETIRSFRTAWDCQTTRAGELFKPAALSTHLLYGPACKLGEQLNRLLGMVERERVHLVFLDDMSNDAQSAYDSVLGFLGLPSFTPNFRKTNEAKARRSRILRRLVSRAGRVKRALRVNRSIGVLDKIDRWNRVPSKWRADPTMEVELREYFKNDIELLSTLSGRNLSHWLESFDRPLVESVTN